MKPTHSTDEIYSTINSDVKGKEHLQLEHSSSTHKGLSSITLNSSTLNILSSPPNRFRSSGANALSLSSEDWIGNDQHSIFQSIVGTIFGRFYFGLWKKDGSLGRVFENLAGYRKVCLMCQLLEIPSDHLPSLIYLSMSSLRANVPSHCSIVQHSRHYHPQVSPTSRPID